MLRKSFSRVAKRMFPFFRKMLNVMFSASGNAALCAQVLAVVLREKNLAVAEAERLVVALRIDVRPVGGEAIPEVFVFSARGGGVQPRDACA